MKTLRLPLLAVLVVGCHFDKLFNDSGGGAAPTGGVAPPAATHLIFATQPSDAAPGATISPAVQVAAADDQDKVVTSFSGTITIAIGHNGGLLQPGTLHGTQSVPTANGVATFPDLSIDQPGTSYYTLVAGSAPLGSVESAHFNIGVP